MQLATVNEAGDGSSIGSSLILLKLSSNVFRGIMAVVFEEFLTKSKRSLGTATGLVALSVGATLFALADVLHDVNVVAEVDILAPADILTTGGGAGGGLVDDDEMLTRAGVGFELLIGIIGGGGALTNAKAVAAGFDAGTSGGGVVGEATILALFPTFPDFPLTSVVFECCVAAAALTFGERF